MEQLDADCRSESLFRIVAEGLGRHKHQHGAKTFASGLHSVINRPIKC